MRSKIFYAVALILIASLNLLSCEGAGNMEEPAGPADDEVEFEYTGAPSARMSSEMSEARALPVFSAVIIERGYSVIAGQAECFKGKDTRTGDVINLVMIPCTVPGDPSRVAFIQYFESGGNYEVNAAEYLEEEGYEIPHPLDEIVYARIKDTGGDAEAKNLIRKSESSKRYWGCVTKRFAAGCAGCATVCLFSGPGWGACTAKCCAGSFIVALISCAFTVYVGW